MGWGYGINAEGREVGYSIEAECDYPDCHAKIDRGLSYVCGGMHDGGEWGCGKYFCSKHHGNLATEDEDDIRSNSEWLCDDCYKLFEEAE